MKLLIFIFIIIFIKTLLSTITIDQPVSITSTALLGNNIINDNEIIYNNDIINSNNINKRINMVTTKVINGNILADSLFYLDENFELSDDFFEQVDTSTVTDTIELSNYYLEILDNQSCNNYISCQTNKTIILNPVIYNFNIGFKLL